MGVEKGLLFEQSDYVRLVRQSHSDGARQCTQREEVKRCGQRSQEVWLPTKKRVANRSAGGASGGGEASCVGRRDAVDADEVKVLVCPSLT